MVQARIAWNNSHKETSWLDANIILLVDPGGDGGWVQWKYLVFEYLCLYSFLLFFLRKVSFLWNCDPRSIPSMKVNIANKSSIRVKSAEQ